MFIQEFDKTIARCLYIGRFQPLHEGHCALIRERLDKGEPCLVCIRKTRLEPDNPYTYAEKWQMFYKAFKAEMDNQMLVVMEFPNIKEVCFGRNVGYKITKIDLPQELKEISATKIRNNKK